MSNFRNNITKCLYNDSGFCKFSKECRKQHFENVCQTKNCDKRCLNRHPKPCKFKDECKFLEKNICAYSHLDLATENNDLKEIAKSFSDKICDLEDKINNMRNEIDNKLKSMGDEIENEKKINANHLSVQKELKKENEVLENLLKKEMKEINLKVLKVVKSNEQFEMKIEAKFKKENEKLVEKLNNIQNKAVKEAVENTVNQMKVQLTQHNSKGDSELNEKKTKTKTKKVKKDVIEKEILEEFENDCEDIFTLKTNCGLDLTEHKCKKCDFETHSLGILRKHNKDTHQLKESTENIIIGFKSDIRSYVYILETMGEELNIIICEKCDFKTNSKGELKLHENEMH